MTPLDAETQRLLAIDDQWQACRCSKLDRWGKDGDPIGRCIHERNMHDEAEAAFAHIRSLSERLARVEAETREKCAKVCDEYPLRDPAEDGNGYWAAQECAAAIRAGE